MQSVKLPENSVLPVLTQHFAVMEYKCLKIIYSCDKNLQGWNVNVFAYQWFVFTCDSRRILQPWKQIALIRSYTLVKLSLIQVITWITVTQCCLMLPVNGRMAYATC